MENMGAEPRLLPHDMDAEKAILGAIMLHPPALFDVQAMLVPEDFYLEGHRHIFRAMLELFSHETPIDILTVKQELQRTGKLDQAGGAAYVTGLTEGIPRATAVKHYAGMVKQAGSLRKILQISSDAQGMVMAGEDTSRDIIEWMQLELLKLSQNQDGKGFVHVKEYAEAAYRQIDEISHRRMTVTGLPYGFRDLDRLTQGMQPGQLILIAGRPGHGKTSLAQNIVDNLVMRKDRKAGVFSLEMSGIELAKRSICSETPMDSYSIPSGGVPWIRVQEVCNSLSQSSLWIDESAGLTIMDLRAKAQRLAIENKVEILVVDYLQLMAGTGKKHDNREREISEISRGLKILAKDLAIPVLALSQLNREIEKTMRRPQLSDLRESGSLEQDADVVLFIWRDEVRSPSPENEGKAEIILAKQRSGRSAKTVDLFFEKEYCRFREIAHA